MPKAKAGNKKVVNFRKKQDQKISKQFNKILKGFFNLFRMPKKRKRKKRKRR